MRRGFDISFIKGAERFKQGGRRGFDDGCNESVREDFDEVVERFKRVLHRPSMRVSMNVAKRVPKKLRRGIKGGLDDGFDEEQGCSKSSSRGLTKVPGRVSITVPMKVTTKV